MGSLTPQQALRDHVPELVKDLKPLSLLPADAPLDLIIGLPHRDQDKLTQLLHDIYDPASPRFRHYLTPAEFTQMFSPTEEDYQELLSFVNAEHLQVVASFPNRTLLQIKASSSEITRVFHVSLYIYQHPTQKRTFFAPNTEPSVDLGIPLLHITGLDNITLPFPGPARTGSVPRANVGSGSNGNFTAADIRAAYVPSVSLTGSGQVVGLLSLGAYDPRDIQLYEASAGLPNVLLQNVNLPGFNPGAPEIEATLDIEMVIAMAPGLSKIVIYGAPSSSIPALLNEMANPTMGEPLPNQLSTSYALNYGKNSSNEQIFKQMACQGQAFFAASGDDGAYFPVSRSGDFPPADSEYVTSVGGTMLKTTGPAGSWVSEATWPGSGGGYGWFPIPWWQQGVANAVNGASTTLRNCPDVAMVATGIEIVMLGQKTSVSGTSASSPLWAAFTALANQQAAAHGFPPVGFINPAIYAIGRSAQYSSAFHDIADMGKNTSVARDGTLEASFMSVPGYDLVTGWGTPTGLGLINLLALRSPLSPPLTGAVLHYVRSHDCDPGPVAEGTATFAVSVTGGASPFSYLWQETNVPITRGGQASSGLITVVVPPLGQTASLTVRVTDAAGNTITTSLTISGIDQTRASIEMSLCRLLHNLDRFKRPLYVNPGDPGPVDIKANLYSAFELEIMQNFASQLAANAQSLRQRGAGR